jgi:hypothetical protein
LVPTKHRRQAEVLLKQFNVRGNELTWNSDGIIFIDQTSVPESNIYVLFPYLYKMKHPKNLPGFDDFIKKLHEMGLDHLILKRYSPLQRAKPTSKQSTVNWWFLE